MSKQAKKPIQVPSNVELKKGDKIIHVKGPKGQLNVEVMEGIDVEIGKGTVLVSSNEKLQHFANLGLNRKLLLNAIEGVAKGYEVKLELVGVGYKAALKGNQLDLSLGLSHPCLMEIPKGIEVKIDKGTAISIVGIDRQVVGQFAASVRAKKRPEPYKGKGIRYQDEVVRRKAGKTAK